MRVAVVGSRGQLGAALVWAFADGHEVVPLDRTALDITNPVAVAEAMARVRPEAILNAAAYNAVDAAEDAAVDALQTNALAVRSLARAARSSGAALVHFSTDFVFDGRGSRPYTEADPPNPRSVYATSKLIGEWFAADAPRAYVLRVESLFDRAPEGPPAKGSVATIVAALRGGRTARVFEDRTVSPTSVLDAARATRALVERRAEPGLYHCVNTGHCTWLELAREAARQLAVTPQLEIVRQADVRLRAERPQYCALANEKLARAGVVMPTWQDALGRYVRS
jgi:dTDP-4-dehydrorhamnose reductase